MTKAQRLLYAAVGRRIAIARNIEGVTQERLAKALKMSRANLTNIEAGRCAILLHHVYGVAATLNVSVHALLPKNAPAEVAP